MGVRAGLRRKRHAALDLALVCAEQRPVRMAQSQRRYRRLGRTRDMKSVPAQCWTAHAARNVHMTNVLLMVLTNFL